MVHDSDIRGLSWEAVRDHHVVIDFAILTSHFYIHDALDFDVPFLLVALACVIRVSTESEYFCFEVGVDVENLLDRFFDDELRTK